MRTRISKSFRPSFDALETRDAMSSLGSTANSTLLMIPPSSTSSPDLVHETTHAQDGNTGAEVHYVPRGIIAILIG